MIKKIFAGRAGRIEFLIYFFFEIIANITALYLNAHQSLDDETIIYLFYTNLIILITLIPIQAVTTRRLRDLKINGGWIFINFIPLVNILFKIYLCTAKSKYHPHMKDIIDYLNEFKSEVAIWLAKPTVAAPAGPMNRIMAAIDLSIEIVNANRKVAADEKEMFEGGYYLARYFDGWGENYETKYSTMSDYIQKNHY